MRIYLMQHGRARSKEEDPDRPLTEDGRDDVRRVAARLAAADAVPGRIVHSGKTRARETAEEVARALGSVGPSPGVEEADDLGPLDDTEEWARRLGEEEKQGTLLVGHLPFMETLAARLVADAEDRPVVRFQKGGVLCLERDDARWRVAWFVTPEVA